MKSRFRLSSISMWRINSRLLLNFFELASTLIKLEIAPKKRLACDKMLGEVYQINIKGRVAGARGLPKHPVESNTILKTGLEGDFNVYRHEELADDPDSAVLLMPLETIAELNKEGWPIKAGDIGENITTK